MTLNDIQLFVNIVAGYHPADRADDSGNGGVGADQITYWSFTDKAENWYIMKQNNTTGAYRYYRGSGNYATTWGLRETFTSNYDYFHKIFNTL